MGIYAFPPKRLSTDNQEAIESQHLSPFFDQHCPNYFPTTTATRLFLNPLHGSYIKSFEKRTNTSNTHSKEVDDELHEETIIAIPVFSAAQHHDFDMLFNSKYGRQKAHTAS